MDPQQRSIFIQKLQRDREAQLRAQQQQKLMAQRQQMMAQQSQQQQMSGQFGAPAGIGFHCEIFSAFLSKYFPGQPSQQMLPHGGGPGVAMPVVAQQGIVQMPPQAGQPQQWGGAGPATPTSGYPQHR